MWTLEPKRWGCESYFHYSLVLCPSETHSSLGEWWGWGTLGLGCAWLHTGCAPCSQVLVGCERTVGLCWIKKKKKKDYFIFRLGWFFIAAHGLSLVVVSGGYTLLLCVGFSLQWLLDAEQGCRCLGSEIAVRLSLAALRHMGSSWTGDETSVPCIARWILNHCFPGRASGKEHACQCRIHESVSQSVQ